MPDSQIREEKARSDEPTYSAANLSVPCSFAASGTYDARAPNRAHVVKSENL